MYYFLSFSSRTEDELVVLGPEVHHFLRLSGSFEGD